MEDIVKKAEDVVRNLVKDRRNNILLKTNQIRKFLSAVNNAANKVDVYIATHPEEKIFDEKLTMEIKYLEVMLVYQVGRDNADNTGKKIENRSVDDFVEKAGLRKRIQAIGNSIEKFQEFNRYVEALVAFHKFYGGREK